MSAPRSVVIPVAHQAIGGQPYPRSVNSKAMSISLGTSLNRVSYTFTVDTGSGVLLATCASPYSDANCEGGLPASTNYQLQPSALVTDSATCDATGIGCLLQSDGAGSPDGCFISEQLTGDATTFNVDNGRVAKDAITFDSAVVITSNASSKHPHLQHAAVSRRPAAPVSFTGLFGCAEAYAFCNSTSCLDATSTCPAGPAPASLLQGQCPGSGQGIEAGWTFNVGGPASAMAVPEQAFKAGLISEKVTGFCYQRPQKDADCRASLAPNSAVVLGPALPKALHALSRLYTAPMNPATFPASVPPGMAVPQTHTVRTNVSSISVPIFGSHKLWSSAAFDGVSILWDSGAYGQSTVPAGVYNAFLAYFNAAWAAVNASRALQRYGLAIEACPSAQEVCGANILAGSRHSCLQVRLPGGGNSSVAGVARRVLSLLYPAWIKISPPGGGVMKLPTVFTLNLCGGAGFVDASGVAACSYVQPAPADKPYLWLAGPWFAGRFISFNASGPMPGFPASTGTVSWSDPIASCEF